MRGDFHQRVEVSSASAATDDSIPVEPLLVIEGLMNGKPVRILKDDGCNTNVISKEFYAAHPDLFEARETSVVVSHSQRGSAETSTHVVMNGVLQMGAHRYQSNWAVADSRYDVLLGMPWHVECKPCRDSGGCRHCTTLETWWCRWHQNK